MAASPHRDGQDVDPPQVTHSPSSGQQNHDDRPIAEAATDPSADQELGDDMQGHPATQEQGFYETEVKEQDRWLPIANVARIMKTALPDNAKIAKEAKECMQECVSEFISFITSEASEKCQHEKRKTVNGEDILFAMTSLGFENYCEALKIYLSRYRETSMHKTNEQQPEAQGRVQGRPDLGYDQPVGASAGSDTQFAGSAPGPGSGSENMTGANFAQGSSAPLPGPGGGAAQGMAGGQGPVEPSAAPLASPAQPAFGGAQEEGSSATAFAYPAPAQNGATHY